MAMNGWQEQRTALQKDGYCVVPNVLDAEMLAKVRQVSDRLLDGMSEADRAEQKSTGSLISIYDEPFFAELITYEPALKVLQNLGFVSSKFASGYVISKPPQSPPLFWHQDWWGWNDSCSYSGVIQQVYLMYYLVDTSRHNGCLRAIPGSHRKRHQVHDVTPEAHTTDLRRYDDPQHPAFQWVEGEVDVPVKAGDLVIGDSRGLHAAHANHSDQRRTVITLWYHPQFDELPEPMRAFISKRKDTRGWPKEVYARLGSLIPQYEGEAEPIEWNRVPGDALV
jgi:ectoine hydroxylase-related dioxygenase (phytanoyl-CoA dioxygenase family)